MLVKLQRWFSIKIWKVGDRPSKLKNLTKSKAEVSFRVISIKVKCICKISPSILKIRTLMHSSITTRTDMEGSSILMKFERKKIQYLRVLPSPHPQYPHNLKSTSISITKTKQRGQVTQIPQAPNIDYHQIMVIDTIRSLFIPLILISAVSSERKLLCRIS